MNKNGLTYGMAHLFLTSFVLLGLIVVEEKKDVIMLPKVEQALEKERKEKYSDIEKEIIIEKPSYEKNKKRFTQKITNKNNKNLYFYLYYKKKEITSTYEEDYKKGRTLLSHLEKKIEKEIAEDGLKVKIMTPLDQFTSEVKSLLLKEENLKTLKIYTLEKEIKVSDFTPTTIITSINNLVLSNAKEEISPKNYTLTLTNSNDITQSIKIENIQLPNNNIIEIITGILANDKTTEIKYNIKYTYLN